MIGKPVPCSYALSVHGSSSDFQYVIWQALPGFMCLLSRLCPFTGPNMFQVGQRSVCLAQHFHVLLFIVVHLHIVWESPDACHTPSDSAYVQCSATSIDTRIRRLGHYRVMCWQKCEKSCLTSVRHVSNYPTWHGPLVHGDGFVLYLCHPCPRFAILAT